MASKSSNLTTQTKSIPVILQPRLNSVESHTFKPNNTMSAKFGVHTKAQEVVSAFSSSIAGKTILITGPTPASLGAKTAEYLVSHPTQKPARIVLLGRSQSKTEPLITSLKSQSPATVIDFVTLDLSSQASIREAATATSTLLNTANVKIDVLVANAGIMAVANYQTTPDGIESQFAVNHLGHFLLTNLLLEANLFQPGSRIVNISSEGHFLGHLALPPTADPTTYTLPAVRSALNLDDGNSYNPWAAYSQSKGAQILSTRTLARRLAERDILVFAVHPGMIFGTGLGAHLVDDDVVDLVRYFKDIGREPPVVKTLEEGVSTMLVGILDEGLRDESGAYLEDCKVGEPAVWVMDDESAVRLWRASELLVGQDFTSF